MLGRVRRGACAFSRRRGSATSGSSTERSIRPRHTAPANRARSLWAGRGAMGLAFDQQFGLDRERTGAGAAAVWLAAALRARCGASRSSSSSSTVPYVLVVASFGMWWGGWSAPARFLDAVLPLAVPLMALAWRDSNRAVRGVFVALVLVGASNIVAADRRTRRPAALQQPRRLRPAARLALARREPAAGLSRRSTGRAGSWPR